MHRGAPACTFVCIPVENLLLCFRHRSVGDSIPTLRVKTVAGTPAAGSTIEKTTRTRVIPPGSTPEPFDFWQYLENLKPEDADRHILYVYRDDPAPSMQIGKFVYPWTEIPWNDREEAESCIAQKWGGRNYRVYVKDRSQRMGVGRIYINAPPKPLAPAPEQPVYPGAPPGAQPGYAVTGFGGQPAPGYYGDTGRIAEVAMHTVANQEKQAVEIGIAALKNAAEVLNSVNNRPNSPADDLTRQFMAAMITRMSNPPDPLETFVKMMALVKEMNGGNSQSGIPGIGGSVIDKVLTSIIDRGMNPPAAGPAVSTGAELIRVLPNIAQYVSKGLEDYARITEAQRDVILQQRGAVPGQVVQPPRQVSGPQPVILQPRPAPVQTPANPMTETAPAQGEDVAMFMNPTDFLEGKILEIFNEPQSAEAAAEEALAFLDRMGSTIVPQLIQQGEQGLMALFNTRPILRPAMNNPARLTEFVRAFVKFANEAPPPGADNPTPAAGGN